MTREELENRISKKEAEIAKMEKNLVKYIVNDEFTAMVDRYFQTKDRTELNAWKEAHHTCMLPEYYGKRYDLEDARNTLAKYHKQLEATVAKENTLNDIPEVIKEFRDNLINRWDRFDAWKQEQIKKEYHEICELSRANGYNCDEVRNAYREMREKWGMNWSDFRYLKPEEIHKANVIAADTLILNLVTRTVEIAGTIKDAQYLRLDRDNNGYCIINGIVIGEKGKARIESIEAGGYNIQRYHIRVLVKEVRD